MTKSLEIKFKVECDWLQRSIELIESPDCPSSILSARLRKLEKHFEDLTAVYMKCLEIELDKTVLNNYEKRYSNANDQYDILEAKLAEYMSSGTEKVSGNVTAQPSQSARLPQINLPTFDGDLFGWTGFISLFGSLVLSRTDITLTEKFHYLFSHLTNEPKTLIQHLPMIDTSLEVALELLYTRYDNKRLLADAYISRILNIQPLKKIQLLRSDILNPLLECTRALKGFGLPVDEWSYLLVHITLTKLPIEIKSRFEHSFGGLRQDLPTFDELIQFLQNECSMIDTANTESILVKQLYTEPRRHSYNTGRQSISKPINLTRRVDQGHRVYSNNIISPRQYNSNSNSTCVFCSMIGHKIDNCFKFKNCTSEDRKNFVHNNRLCFKCFGNHSAAKCYKFIPCDRCGHTGHHPLICTIYLQNQSFHGSPIPSTSGQGMTHNQGMRSECQVHNCLYGSNNVSEVPATEKTDCVPTIHSNENTQ